MTDRLYAHRGLWAWRLYRMGEFPCDFEVIAARGVDDDEIQESRRAVRVMVNNDETPMRWLSSRTVEVSVGDDDEWETWAREYALAHGMDEAELPLKLRKDF